MLFGVMHTIYNVKVTLKSQSENRFGGTNMGYVCCVVIGACIGWMICALVSRNGDE